MCDNIKLLAAKFLVCNLDLRLVYFAIKKKIENVFLNMYTMDVTVFYYQFKICSISVLEVYVN